jgi:hypothetical protein
MLTRAAAATAIAATTALVVTGTAEAAVAGPKSHPTSLSVLAHKAGAKHPSTAAAKAGSTAGAKAGSKSAKAGSTAAAKAKHRDKAAIHGVLKSGKTDLVRKVVFLDRVGAANKLTVVGKVLTNKAGIATFVVSRKTPAKYVLVFKGTGTLAPSHSGIVIVKAS